MLERVLPTFLLLTISPKSIWRPLQGLGYILEFYSQNSLFSQYGRSSSKKCSDWWRIPGVSERVKEGEKYFFVSDNGVQIKIYCRSNKLSFLQPIIPH